MNDGTKILKAIEAQIANTEGETQEHWKAARSAAAKALGERIRRGRPPLDKATALQLLDSGKSSREIAETLGCSRDWVDRLRRAARST